MKPRDVNVSIVESEGKLHVWNASFTLPGSLPRGSNGLVIEAARRKIQKKIAEALATVELEFEDLAYFEEAP